MRGRAVVLAAALIMAPFGANGRRPRRLVGEGYYAEEDEALREIIAAFEQESGKQVELVLYPQEELPDKIVAALEAGQPPDFAFGLVDLTSSSNGRSRIGSSISRTPSATFRTCSIRMCSSW